MDSQDAETYLRLLGETELRRARAGGPDAAAGRAGRMRDVASAFAWAGVLDRELAVAIVDGYDAALDARLTAPYDSLWRPLGARAARLWRREREMYPGSVPPGVLRDVGPVAGTPGGQVVVSGGQADVHVLAAIRTPARALLSVAVHTRDGAGGPLRRPVAGTGPRPRGGAGQARFPPSLTATDADGTGYHIGLKAGGGPDWFFGQAEIRPNPSPGTTWLDVDGGGQPVRIDLTAPSPRAQVAVTPVALSPGEAYLQAQIDWLLARRRPIGGELARLAVMVPALNAVGVLPAGSMMAGRLRWLCDRFGVTGHGLASSPAELPERWRSLLADRDSRTDRPDAYLAGNGDRAQVFTPVAMADLVVTLPGADGLAMTLAGLITRGDCTILCAVYYRTSDREIDPDDWPECWLRDDSGQWHRAVFSSGASEPNAVHWHRLDLLPPLRPSASTVEVHICGRTNEVRALVPLTWRAA